MITLTIIILGILSLGMTIFFFKENSKNRSLKDKNKLSEKRNLELTTMFLSERALITYYSLVHGSGDNKHSFYAVYEVEILEMTKNKAKIKALDVGASTSKMRDIKYRQSLLDYVDGDWVSLKDISFILDSDAAKREIRLRELLDD